jgi:hypothetical protein
MDVVRVGAPRSSRTARFGSAIGLLALAIAAPPAVAGPASAARPDPARVPGCTIVGTAGPDVLVGGPGRDIICGLGGNDRLLGGGGADVLRGGPGADLLRGGSGADVLRGDDGADVLRGGSGDDDLYAGPGDDHARGGEGDDVVRGGTGDDLLSGGPARDVLRARDGDDFRDVLTCGAGERDRAYADSPDVVGENCEINSQNTAPVAVDDTVGAIEDTPLDLPVAGAGSPIANDTDPDGDAVSIVAVSGAVGGTVALSGGTIRFTPTTNLCGPTAGHFDYTLVDGKGGTDVGRVTVAITCTPDDPTAVDDAATVSEDSADTVIDVLANDVDPDGEALVIDDITGPAAHGVVGRSGNVITYTPAAGYCNTPPGSALDTFSYSLTPGGSSATVSVTVTCFDDAPTAVDDSATVDQDAAATAIDVLANDTDTDGGPKSIASVVQPANGTVVITGGGTGLTYQPDPSYCNDPPGTTPDTFTYTLNGGSTATVSMTVTCPDSPPTAVNDSATVGEDSGASAVGVLANDTDPDGGPKVIASASDPANGTVVLTGGTPGAHTGLTYAPDANYCNDPPGTTPDTFTYTLNGGSTATVSVLVDCGPDDPVVDTSAGTLSYTENGPATVIDAAVTVTDADAGATITGATVQVTGNYASGQDLLALAGSHPGIVAAFNAGTGTLTLSGDASPAAYQAALRDVTYRNASDAPSTSARTVTFSVTDDTARSGSNTRGIAVTAVDDPPVAVNDAATVLEDASATAALVLVNDTDVDGGAKVIASASDPANGSVVLTGGTPGAHTGLTYAPDANFCNDPPGTTPDTFTYTLNGGSTASVSVTVTCVNDAPLADDETFSGASAAVGNTSLVVDDPTDGAPTLATPKRSVAGDILAGDTDVDGPGPLVVTAGTFATDDGGSVTIEPDGDFTYTPVAGTSCIDTSDFFDYTVSDQDPTDPKSDTGRVTVGITGCVWYVSNNGTGNSGTSTAPFDTLAQAEAASSSGHTTFVYDGDNTSTGLDTGYAMAAGERLIGEHEGLVVDPDAGGPLEAVTLLPANPGALPTLTATGEDVVDLDDANEVRGFNLDPQGAGGGVAGAPGDTGGGTLDDLTIVDGGTPGTQPGLELDGTAGTFAISNLTVSTTGATGVRLNNAGTVAFDPTGTITINAAGARGLDATGTGLGTSTFDSITVTGSGNGGLSLTNTTGTTTFTNLALTTTSGGAGAFVLSNAGTVTVADGGTANVSAAGGPAVDVTGTSGPTLAFDAVSSASSANDGINLAGLGTGTFTATSGTLAGSAGIAFDLDGGSGTVAYPGAIDNGTGQTAEITGRTGGAVTLNGTISDTNDSGGGISLSGNTGGSTTFGAATKVLNTGTGDAVVMGTSDGHTLTFSGGGLDIDASSGRGIDATTSGTLVVSGSGNTIDTTTGRALNVANTDIGAAGMTFQRISSNGATTGILLNTTGSSGGLTVTGTGAAGSGGVIQNTTADSISLTSTRSVSLTSMNVTASQESGILGANVNGLALAGVNLTNNGNDAADDGIRINNLTGTNAWSALSVTGSARNNVFIDNDSGTLNSLTVTGASHFDAVSAAFGSNAVLVQARGTAVIAGGSIDGATFADNLPARGVTVQAQEGGRIGDAATNAFVVQNSSFTNNGLHASFEQSGTADLTFGLLDNTPMTMPNDTSGTSHAVNVFSSGGSTAGTIRGRISGNTIGNSGVAGSGSAIGSGIRALLQGKTVATLAIINNTIRQTPNARGIDLQFLGPLDPSGVGSPHDVTMTGNDVNPQDTSGFPLSAIYVAADSQGGGTVTVRGDIRNNTVPVGVAIDALPTFLAFDQVVPQGVCQLVNTTGSPTATAQLAATNTGTASASLGCTLIGGPIGTPP